MLSLYKFFSFRFLFLLSFPTEELFISFGFCSGCSEYHRLRDLFGGVENVGKGRGLIVETDISYFMGHK